MGHQVHQALELGRPDQEEPALLLDEAVLHLLVRHEGDGEAVLDPLAGPHQEGPVQHQLEQHLAGLLPGAARVEPGLVLVSVGLRGGLAQDDLELGGAERVGLVVEDQVVQTVEIYLQTQ